MSLNLQQRAAEQFEKHSGLRALFFFDPEEEAREEIEEWDHGTVHCLEVEAAPFQVKCRLETELAGESVFLYFPSPKPEDWTDNPLLDHWVAGRELRIDKVAELMEDLGLDDKHRDLIGRYRKGELEYKNRRSFLGGVLTNEKLSKDNLKWGLAAYHADDVFDNVSFRTVPQEDLVLAALLVGATEDDAFEDFLGRCDDLDLTDLLEERFSERFKLGGTQLSREAAREAAQTMKYNLLLRLVEEPTEEDPYRHLRIEDPLARNQITSLANAWRDTRALKKRLEETLGALAPEVQETKLADVYGPDTTFGYLTPALRKRRLKRATEALGSRPDQARRIAGDLRGDDGPIQAAAECVWQMGTFYKLVENHPTLDFGQAENFIEAYAGELYRCDSTYRRAVASYRRAGRESPGLQGLIEDAYERFLTDYHDTFVHPLNTAWQGALEQHAETGGSLRPGAVDRQGRFHADHVATRKQKTAVIVSDALRYEVAKELVGTLSEDARKEIDLSATLAALPTVTSVGMAHLLPHESITLDEDGAPEISGRSTSGTRNRERVLQESDPDAAAFRFEEIEGKSQEEGRTLFQEHPLAYVYHDRIDATGDDRETQAEVIPAIEKTVSELARMIQTLNNWNVRRVLVTADHGFLYSESTIPESMIESFPKAEGTRLRKSRSITAESFGEEPGYSFPLSALSDVGGGDDNLKVGVPRAVNRYRLRGAGKRFAHGGASLQEMIVPTLEVNKSREEVAEKVGVRLLSGDRTINTGALTAKLIQEEAVSSGRQPRTVHAALYDEGEIVSEEKTITLDAQAKDPTERQEKLVLTLGPEASELTFCTLKVFDTDDRLNPLIEQKYSVQQLIERDF
jgi:hypothetical protein